MTVWWVRYYCMGSMSGTWLDLAQGFPFGAVFMMGFLADQHVKTGGFGSVVGFTKGSSQSLRLPFDIMFLDKDKSPGCHSPHCFSFLSPLCFCALPHEPKLA